MNLQDEINRGQHARELLDNPLLQEALNHYETEITEAWKTAPLRDADGLLKLRQMLEAHRKFRQFLETTLQSGEMARVQVQEQSRLAKLGAIANPFRPR